MKYEYEDLFEFGARIKEDGFSRIGVKLMTVQEGLYLSHYLVLTSGAFDALLYFQKVVGITNPNSESRDISEQKAKEEGQKLIEQLKTMIDSEKTTLFNGRMSL